MTAVRLSAKGGQRMNRVLALMQDAFQSQQVRVGFLENATYPKTDGARLRDALNRLSEAQKVEHPDWAPRLKAWANWSDKHHPTIHVAQVAFWNEFGTSTAKPRPFFRSMIGANSASWGDDLGQFLKDTKDSKRALSLMGIEISDQLKTSITNWRPDNADLTVHIKGFNKGLTDNSDMKRAVDFEVVGR